MTATENESKDVTRPRRWLPLLPLAVFAALAGVLMITAMRMIDVHNIATILRVTRSDALIMAVT